jgi:hypothetical protein
MIKNFVLVAIISHLVFVPSLLHAQQDREAIFYFEPQAGINSIGEELWIDLYVDTKGQQINAVAAYFSYPDDTLDAIGVDQSESVLTLRIEKEAKDGEVKISGGKPTPGFAGIQKIASLGFITTAPGEVSFTLHENSAILTDVGNQNILQYEESLNQKFVIENGEEGTQGPQGSDGNTLANDEIKEKNKEIFTLFFLIVSFILVAILVYIYKFKKRTNSSKT